ncbi:MAG TPA: S8 family serine peptidase [Mycobacteriales bacterium]|nr:S8 family serine peptidase [Mycobacteriales bacterium]
MRLTSAALRRVPVVVGTALALVASAGLVAPAADARPAPAGTPPTATAAAATAASSVVTLVTGDKAVVSWHGGQPSVSVTAAVRSDGSRPAFVSYNRGQDAFVVPVDVLPYIRSGTVDERLFDVTYLAGNGYGDTSSGSLPVIVRYGKGQRAASLPGSRLRRQLGSIRAAALTVPKAQAPAFWAGVQNPAVRPAAAAAARSLRPGRGLDRIWLDGKLHVQLDQSVPLIGAPAAWAAGYDGRGVTVAILDTGVDATHPDLAGRIAGTANFTGEPDATDHNGHGTHVASTVAGSGAAAAGRYRGVAPSASLLIGKVCDSGGNCSDSSVLAGMQWAASSGARVVSMSLGRTATGGPDPLADAVDTLTAATGTLFVIAAGNDGPGESTVGTPGLAAAALTVAATDKSDHLAGFSSRGPLLGDRLMKPDIAAPGVNIVAARAAGTTLGQPVGDSYTTLSGTSMATPHVSGAAAILAQEHPDWRAPQLKAALMGSAKDDGYTVFEQGAGRVDLARAVGQQVRSATPNLEFGVLPFPQNTPTSATISYVNDGTAPVTLTLHPSLAGANGTPVPAGALTADATVTVPAGGTATATVTLDAPALAADRYTGAVVATDASGSVQLRTPVGADRRPELFNVQVTVVGRQGLVCGTGGEYGTGIVTANANCKSVLQVVYQNVDDVRYRSISGAGARNTFRVPAGHYLFAAYLLWDDPVSRQQQTAFLMAPEVTVTGATSVTLDARTAQPITVHTQQPSESFTASMGFWRMSDDPTQGMFLVIVSAYGFQSYWANPTEPVRRGHFLFFHQRDAAAPLVEMRVAGRGGTPLHPMYSDYRDYLPMLAGDQTLPLVDAGTSIPTDPGDRLRGRLVLLEHVVATQGGCTPRQDQVDAAAAAGAAALLLFEPTGCFAPLPMLTLRRKPLPVITLRPAEGALLRQQLAAHPVRIAVHGTPISTYLYHLKFYQQGRISTLSFRPSDRQLERVRSAYHTAQRSRGSLTWPTWLGPEAATFMASLDYHMPLVRDEYGGPVQPGQQFTRDTFQWNESESELWGEQYRTDPLVAGRTSTTDWYAPPGVPGAQQPPTGAGELAACGSCRQGDLFSPVLPLTLPDPALQAPFTELGVTGNLHLYRGTEEIPVTPVLDLITAFRLPAEAAGYRLTQNLDGSFADRPEAATHIQTEWTFRSARPTVDGLATGQICVGTAFGTSGEPCAVQPLVFLRYALGTDLHDQVGRQPHPVRITAYHEAAARPAAAIRSLALWASFDDGVSWQRVPTAGRGGTYAAIVPAPPRGSTATAVTLRATATDAAGNTVTQTVYRAYHLRAR